MASSGLEQIHLADAIANRPAATAVSPGVMFFATDTGAISRSNGSSWIDIPVGGGGGGWELAGTGQTSTGIWTHAADGDTAPIIFDDLGGYSEIMVIANGLEMSSSGFRNLQVGHGAGPTFLTSSGDYQLHAGNGTLSATTVMAGHSSASSSARYVNWNIRPFNSTLGYKRYRTTHGSQGVGLIPTTNALTAVQVVASTGTFDGGAVYCFGLPE